MRPYAPDPREKYQRAYCGDSSFHSRLEITEPFYIFEGYVYARLVACQLLMQTRNGGAVSGALS